MSNFDSNGGYSLTNTVFTAISWFLHVLLTILFMFALGSMFSTKAMPLLAILVLSALLITLYAAAILSLDRGVTLLKYIYINETINKRIKEDQ